MKTIFQLTLVAVLLTFLSSCVSYRKYEELENSQAELKRSTMSMQAEREAMEAQVKEMTLRIKSLQEEQREIRKSNAELTEDLQVARDRYQLLDKTNRDLLDRYDRMLNDSKQQLNMSASEKDELAQQLEKQRLELSKKEADLRKLEGEIQARESKVSNLQATLTDREKQVQDLQAAIAAKDQALNDIRQKINSALLGLSDADLSVTEKEGKIYVSLSQNLLFASGSKTINAAGKDALRKLAQVLQANPDIAITVEGHTDTDGDEQLNWNLSTGRAISVVNELTNNGVSPKRVIAAGRGEFFPIAPNTTAEGKARNRRTEIILSPNLDKLYDIINQ